jgi:hypothetical protein
MSELLPLEFEKIINLAAEALSRVSGRTCRLEQVQSLSAPERRNLVARAVARSDDGEAQPVIVKATRSSGYNSTDEKALDESGLVREWIATAHLSATVSRRHHGAALLAGDVARGILVFEDLGEDLPSLVDPLLGASANEAEAALRSYATALGRLHADTAGCLQAYHETYQAIFGSGRSRRPLGWQVETDANVIVGAIGNVPPKDELELLSSRLRDPGPWQSLVHGDPCPDNVLLRDGRARLIDYEWARPSHALLDGIYWRLGFPTCWCAGRTPADVCDRIDAIYRKEISRTMPGALDDTAYRTELTYMAAVWLFTCLSWRLEEALKSDEKWGRWSIRGRLLWYLQTIVRMTDEADVLPGIKRAAQAWLADLSGRWPGATPLGLFPAFAPGAPKQTF